MCSLPFLVNHWQSLKSEETRGKGDQVRAFQAPPKGGIRRSATVGCCQTEWRFNATTASRFSKVGSRYFLCEIFWSLRLANNPKSFKHNTSTMCRLSSWVAFCNFRCNQFLKHISMYWLLQFNAPHLQSPKRTWERYSRECMLITFGRTRNEYLIQKQLSVAIVFKL